MQAFNESELKKLMEEIKKSLPDFPVALKDLKTPKAQFMTGYFYAVLEDSGVDTSGVVVHPKYGLEHGDVNAHIIPAMRLFHLVKAFFPQEVGLLENMSIDTFLDPKPSDILYIRAMNNFHQFSVRRVLDIFENSVIKEQNDKVSSFEEMTIKRDELKALMFQQVENGHLMDSRILELIDSIKKMTEESAHLQSILESEQKYAKDFKETESSILREIEKLDKELSVEAQQYQSLAPQLVQSPERILLNKEDLKRKMESLRKEMMDLSAQLSALKKSKKEIETVETLLQRFTEGLEAVRSSNKEFRDKELANSARNSKQEQKHTKKANMMKKSHVLEKAIEDYNSQIVAPFEEKIKEIERKEEEISKSFVDLRSRVKELVPNEKLREEYFGVSTQHNEELQAIGKEYNFINERCKAFILETRQTWAAIAEKEREELRILKEEAEKEVRRVFSE
ncbi:chromosome partition protein Smc [Anabrus simplex]|uniref:chromosome partition protein Smc n=1 Tax=Anabrus simplex TaxID=316456 RepID=UPI0035A2CAB2